MAKRRVVVTGLGMLTGLGTSVESTWQGITAGRSGIRSITEFDCSNLNTQFAGQVPGFVVDDFMPAKDARRIDAFIQYGLAAGAQAMKDSGLEITDANADRVGVLVGSGIGGLSTIEATHI
ncbi:MAG: beta-ketoacyl synthase N-terminal-like domain-containing protein, partial [Paraperlucidibaca sp.]